MNVQLEKYKEQYPSVFATEPIERATNRYTFVSTEKLVSNFLDLGMTIHSIKTPKVRKASALYSKHLIRLNIEDKSLNVGDEIPQLLIVNSHNLLAGLTMQLGVFRLVCSNGLIVADTDFANFYQKHMNLDIDGAYHIMQSAVSELKNIYSRMNDYKNTMLTERQQKEFVNQALTMIYNENAGRYEVNDFIKVRREEDTLPSLWNTMNVLQETYTKGGAIYTTKKGHKMSKAIKSIDREVKSNIILWGLMVEYYNTIKR